MTAYALRNEPARVAATITDYLQLLEQNAPWFPAAQFVDLVRADQDRQTREYLAQKIEVRSEEHASRMASNTITPMTEKDHVWWDRLVTALRHQAANTVATVRGA